MNPAVGGAHDEPSSDNENGLHYHTGLFVKRATSRVRSGSCPLRARVQVDPSMPSKGRDAVLYSWEALKTRVQARMSKTLLVYFTTLAAFALWTRNSRRTSRGRSFSASTGGSSSPPSTRIRTGASAPSGSATSRRSYSRSPPERGAGRRPEARSARGCALVDALQWGAVTEETSVHRRASPPPSSTGGRVLLPDEDGDAAR